VSVTWVKVRVDDRSINDVMVVGIPTSGVGYDTLASYTEAAAVVRLSSARRHSTPYHARACGLVVAQAVFCSLAPRNDVATAAGGAIWLRRAVRCGALCLSWRLGAKQRACRWPNVRGACARGWLACEQPPFDGALIVVVRAGQALVDLYNATNGPEWSRNTNWLNGDPCSQQ